MMYFSFSLGHLPQSYFAGANSRKVHTPVYNEEDKKQHQSNKSINFLA